eukprot:jgi/Mesen1/4900/ME000244S04072
MQSMAALSLSSSSSFACLLNGSGSLSPINDGLRSFHQVGRGKQAFAGTHNRIQGLIIRSEKVDTEPVASEIQRLPQKGWFYDKFVKDNTYQAKVAKIKEGLKENGGVVGSLFDDAFKYTAWIEVHTVLTEMGMPSIEPKEALEMVNTRGAVLLDVNEAGDYEKIHAKGAANAALFRLITGDDMKANMRRLGNALLANFAGTERNPLFLAQAEAAVQGDKERPVIVYCSRGGTLETVVVRGGSKPKSFKDPERAFGIPSRSFKACYELHKVGFKNVVHLKGGLNQWIHLDLPLGGPGY